MLRLNQPFSLRWLALLGLVLWPQSSAWAQACELIVQADDFERRQVNGEWVYLMPAARFDALQRQGCMPVTQLLQDNQQSIAELQRQVVEQQQLITDYQRQIELYQQVVAEASRINQRYDNLASSYQQQLQQQQSLIQRYQQTADEFDALAGDYRDLAAQGLSRYRLGLALGAGNEGMAGAVQFGVGRWLVLLHSLDGHASALVGTEIRF
jgi:hypothetical protein